MIPYLNDRGMGSVPWSVAVFSYPLSSQVCQGWDKTGRPSGNKHYSPSPYIGSAGLSASWSITNVAQECQPTAFCISTKDYPIWFTVIFRMIQSPPSMKLHHFLKPDMLAPRKAFLEGRQLLIISQIQLPLAAAICVEIQAGFSTLRCIGGKSPGNPAIELQNHHVPLCKDQVGL